MRHFLWHPAKTLVYDVCGLSNDSYLAYVLAVSTSFILSGIMHSTADIATNPTHPMSELGSLRFFATQACGLLFEESLRRVMWGPRKSHPSTSVQEVQQSSHPSEKKLLQGSSTTGSIRNPSKKYQVLRVVGYAWVVAFLTWTGPSWIYPQAAKPPVEGNYFLPFSVIRTLRTWPRD